MLDTWTQSPLAVAIWPGGTEEIRSQEALQTALKRSGDLVLQQPIPQLHSRTNAASVKTAWNRTAHRFSIKSLRDKPEELGRLTSEELRHISQYVIQELNSHCKRRHSCHVTRVKLLFLRGPVKRWYFLGFSHLAVSHCHSRPVTLTPAPLEHSPVRERISSPKPAVESVRELRQQMNWLVERQEALLAEDNHSASR